MICSSLYLLFLMSAILLMSGLHFLYFGTAEGEQVIGWTTYQQFFGRLRATLGQEHGRYIDYVIQRYGRSAD